MGARLQALRAALSRGHQAEEPAPGPARINASPAAAPLVWPLLPGRPKSQ